MRNTEKFIPFNIDGHDMGTLVPTETIPGWGGVQHIFTFSNGYEASVVRHGGSYGSRQGLWEIAVLKDGDITYDTSVMSDVIGYVPTADIPKILDTISKIEPREV